MIRCRFLPAQTRLSRWLPPIWTTLTQHSSLVTLHRTSRYPSAPRSTSTQSRSRYELFNRIPRPVPGDLAAWLVLLDCSLPRHLRADQSAEVNGEFTANDVAEILLAAQRQSIPAEGFDLLYHLGIVEGRWRAVVWLINCLIDAFAPSSLDSSRLSQTIRHIDEDETLAHATSNPINLPRYTHESKKRAWPHDLNTLEAITDDLKPEKYEKSTLLRHSALGQIWRSLGKMTLACTDVDIKPEILEIIAFLHHREMMPSSIYKFRRSSDATRLHVPPMLHLFSSRILTSLSDAAWRAHAKLVVDEAKAKGGDYAPLRPEIPGTAFRVSVAGLRTEVWLELILWSALLGGWIREGSEILSAVARQAEPHTWKAYSWRSLVADRTLSEHSWDALEKSLNTSFSSRAGASANNGVLVHRTISSEVVTAYVDALPSAMRMGVGERGISPALVLIFMTMFRGFLRRSGLTLSAGTWDAIVARYIDIQQSVITRPDPLEQLADLLPLIGEGLNRESQRDLPSYVLDGNALVISLFHQAIRARVSAGDLKGAIRLLQKLQQVLDRNKRQSLLDFLQQQTSSLETQTQLSEAELFTSNFQGIDYPAFHAQVPATVLAPLLELVVDAKAYEFGKWLIYNDDIDGSVTASSTYDDPALMPSLVRFATEIDDKPLLRKVFDEYKKTTTAKSLDTSGAVLQHVLSGQILSKRWETATKILVQTREQNDQTWTPQNLANLARIMLFESRTFSTGEGGSKRDFDQSTTLFKLMVQGEFNLSGLPKALDVQVGLILLVLSTVNPTWTRFCEELRPFKSHYSLFLLPLQTFHILLRGIVETYGSGSGRQVLEKFWTKNSWVAWLIGRRHVRKDANEPIMPDRRVSRNEMPDRQRLTVQIAGADSKSVVIYGGVEPNIQTIRIIAQQAFMEYNRDIASTAVQTDGDCTEATELREAIGGPPADVIAWAVRQLRSLHMSDTDIRDLMRDRLSSDALQAFDSVHYSELFPKLPIEVEDMPGSESISSN